MSWKTSKLIEIANLVMGQSPDSSFYNSEEKGMKFLQGCAEFGDKHPQPILYSSSIKKIAPRNSILFSVRAPVGKINYADDEYCIGRGLASIIPIRCDLFFLYQVFLYHQQQTKFISQGSTFDSINSLELSELKIPHPEDISEQTRIAQILSKADAAIAQTEALIAKYQRIKTGLIQDLLTKGIDEHGNIRSKATHRFVVKNGIEVPEEWEIKTTKEIAKITTGASDTQDRDDTGQYLFFVRSQTIERSNRYLFDGEGVLTSGDGVGVGKIYHYVNGKFDFHQRVYLVYDFANDLILGKYFYYFFKEYFYDEVSKYSAKTTVDSVRMNMISDMLIPVPKVSEQLKIIEALDKIDDFIKSEYEELNKLRSLKTGLMQDLLSGRVRVKVSESEFSEWEN